MIEITFREFHNQQYEPMLYGLYVMKNGLGDVLYVGISTNDVWERWFGFGGHLTWDGDVIYGESAIGAKIENHLPDSLDWKIQLWSLKDCREFCCDQSPTDLSKATIHDLEPVMIRKLSPALNTTYNLSAGRDTNPKNKKEIERERSLDRSYREIFDKE